MESKKERFWNAFWFTFVPLVFVASVAVFAINNNSNDAGNRSARAIVNYLDCVGHIEKPVAQRIQTDYDVCLDRMREEVK